MYDSVINVDGSFDTSWLPTFRAQVERGRLGHALALVERHLGMSQTLARTRWMGAAADARLVVSPKGVHGSIPAVRHHMVDSQALWLRDRPLGDLDLGPAALQKLA